MPKISEQQELIEGFLLRIVEASASLGEQRWRLSDARNYMRLVEEIDPEVAQKLIRGLIEGELVTRESTLVLALVQQVAAKSGIELADVQKRTLVEAQRSWTSQLDTAQKLGILGPVFQTLLLQAANEGNALTFFNLTDPIPPGVQQLGCGEPDDGLKLQLLFNYAKKQLIAGRDNDIVATAQRLEMLEMARGELIALAIKHGRPSLYAELMPSPAHCSAIELAQLMKNADQRAALACDDSEEGGTDSR